MTVTHSNQRAETGIECVTRSTEILNQISGMMSRINDMNIQVAAAAEQQGVTAEEISKNVTRVTDLSRGVSEQTEQTSLASDELAELGASLRDMVKIFKL
jgi:methyl-accepting chemotaxis protein